MSISTTGFYGLHRDFLDMIPDGHTAFTAHKARDFDSLDPAAKAYELKKQAQREAWHRQRERKNERARIARGTNDLTPEQQILRVNKHSPICVPSGESLHRRAIREEIARAA